MQHVPPALDQPLIFHVFFGTACARHDASTWMVKNKDAELDVRTNLTLSHNDCQFHSNSVTAAWRNAAILPRRGLLSHDLITHIFLRSLQYGIVVTGNIDAFVYAHNHHRRNLFDPGNFGDCMEERIQLMTAITPTYAHAYHSICLAGRPLVVPHQKFRRTTTRVKGNGFQGWAIYTDGGTRVSDRETIAGWGAAARSPDGRLFFMFGPVITTEAHLACAGARIHSNNTATNVYSLRFQTRCQHLLGHCPVRRERLPWAHLPASAVTTLVEVTVFYATHLQSRAESRE